MARFDPDVAETTGRIGRFVPDEQVQPKAPKVSRYTISGEAANSGRAILTALNDAQRKAFLSANVGDVIPAGFGFNRPITKVSDTEWEQRDVNEEFDDSSFTESALRQAGLSIPAQVAGARATASAARALSGFQASPNPIAKTVGYAGPILAGVTAAGATQLGVGKAAEEFSPRLAGVMAEDQQKQPLASIIGPSAAGGALFKVGALEKSLGEFIKNRSVPAAIGGAVQAGSDLALSGEIDPSAVAAGAITEGVLKSPNALGARVMGLNKVKPKTPITDSISSGSGTTKGSVNDALARANEVAMGKSEGLEGFQPVEPAPTMEFEQPVNGRAGDFSPFTNPAEEAAALFEARRTEAEARSAPMEPITNPAAETELAKGRIAPQEVLARFDELIGQQNEKIGQLESELAAAKLAQEVEAKNRDAKLRVAQGLGEGDLGEFTLPPRMEFEVDAPKTIDQQMAEQIAFNSRVKKVADDLQAEGVKIDRKTAVELARLAPNPQGFNALRSQIIRASRPATPETRRAPLKSLQDLDVPVNQPEAPIATREEPTYQYTHWSPEDTGLGRSVTQIDEIVGGKNVRSSNLAKLAEEGIELPTIPEGLPTGRYTADEINQFAAKQAPAPQSVQETPKIEANEPAIASVAARFVPDQPATATESASAKSIRLSREAVAKSKKTIADSMEKIAAQEKEDSYNKAFDRLSEIEMDPEANKGMATRFAKSLEKKGLLTPEEVAEVQRVSKDKDMGVEDVAGEIKSILEVKQSKERKRSSSSMGIVPGDDLSVKLVKKAVSAANEKLMKMMAKTSVEASQPEPVYSVFPETVDQVADDLVIKSYDAGNEATPKVQESLVNAIMAAPAPYRAGLTDLASRFPLLFDNVIGKVFSDTIGGMARVVKSHGGTVIGNIREASPRVEGALSESIFKVGKMRHYLTSKIDPLGNLARKVMSREDYSELNVANLTGDREMAQAVFARYGDNQTKLLKAYDDAQNAFAEVAQMLRDRGLEVPAKEDYFPRILRDRKGLLKALGADRNIFEDAVSQRRKAKITAEENKKGESLTAEEKQNVVVTDEEETEILNQLVAGSFRGGAGKKGYLQQRTIQKITPDMGRFYEPFDVAANMYVQKVTRDISNIDMLGRTKPGGKYQEIDGSIGQIIKEEIRAKRLNSEGLEIVLNNLNAYVKHTSKYETDLGKAANFFRKLQTYAYLSDFGSAIIQASEIFPIIWRYGAINALKSGRKFTNEEMGLYEGNQDLIGLKYTDKDANIAIKALQQVDRVYAFAVKNFIGRADQFMTGVQSKAAFSWINNLVKNQDSKAFKKMNAEYSAMFGPDKWSKILADLQSAEFRAGKLNENTGLFMLTEIAQLKPIDSAHRTQAYNEAGPWKKLLYSLRTYPIKQIDVLRKNIYENIKKGTKQGYYDAFGALGTYMVLVASGQQVMNYVRDKFFNRESQFGEYVATGALQTVMIPRYAVYRARESSVPDALLDTFIPGLGFTRDVSDDMFLLRDKVFDRKDSKGYKTVKDWGEAFEKARTPQYLPAVGRSLYWHMGKGAKSEEKKEQDRLNGKEQESTHEMLLSLLFPKNLASPRKD